MEDVVREPCPRCGEPAAIGGLVCPHCQASLATDIITERPIADARTLYRVARTVAQIAGVPFLQVQEALSRPGGFVVRGANRLQVRQIAAAVQEGGGKIQTVTTPPISAPTPAPRASRKAVSRGWKILRFGMRTLSVLGALFFLLFLVSIVSSGRRFGDRILFGPLRPAEIAERAMNSTVMIRCHESMGSGFFVTDELLVTNAHVIGKDDRSVDVFFRDGRKQAGTLVNENRQFDLALLRVPGAKARPLPLGDAALLQAGDRVIVVGNPVGLEFTVGQGIVSNSKRVILGIGYTQIDANVHPGNSGGPLLLGETGAVVGVVSMKVREATGLGLALPINYLYDGPAKLVDVKQPADLTRWREYLSQVHRDEQKEIEEARSAFASPGLVACAVDANGAGEAVVVQRATTPPPQRKLDFSVQRDAKVVCRPSGWIDSWRLIESRDPVGADDRLIAWLRRNNLERNLYAGSLSLELGGCPSPTTLVGAMLVLSDSDPNADRAIIERAD